MQARAVAAHVRAILPAFCGISGSTKTILNIIVLLYIRIFTILHFLHAFGKHWQKEYGIIAKIPLILINEGGAFRRNKQMQFEKTETFKNLARSFAGESQAGMRYQLTAKLAGQQNLKTLSDAIRTIAKNETYHAKRFFEIFQEKAGSHDNIVLDAGYPFHAGTLEDNLRFAAIDEKSESTEIYPTFADTAEKEGFRDIAAPLPYGSRSGKTAQHYFQLSLRSGEKRNALQKRLADFMGLQRMRLYARRDGSVENLPFM